MAALLAYVLSSAIPASAQAGDAEILAGLQGNAKLIGAEAVLADFISGAEETGVIVLLRPSDRANDLAAQSRRSARVPSEFRTPGAPTFYNLQDRAIRKQLRATVTETVAGAVGRLAGKGMQVSQRFSYQFGFAARVSPAALQRIVDDPEVLAVEKDHLLQPHLAQGIPLINAATPRSAYDGSGLSIAICDTGIDTSHPRLGGTGSPLDPKFNAKVIGGSDTGDDDDDPRPDSVNGQAHGTACAGIAAGDTGTVGDYIGGVAPAAKLYAIKISQGNTGDASFSTMTAGWEWVITHQDDDPFNPIMVISTSFGGLKFTAICDSYYQSMTTAAANAVAAGITIFASSGNDGYCDAISFPACISYVNSVGAVYDASMGTYGFCVDADSCATKEANNGCSTGYAAWDDTAGDMVTSYSNSASFLTLFAPSHDAYTTDIVGTGGYSSGDYDPEFGGTSAASPYAAGAAAVLQNAAMAETGTFLTPAQVRQYLVDNGDSVTDPKVAVTRPRINLANSVAALTPTLTVNKDGTGNGMVTSIPPGIDCGSDCTETYTNNTTSVTLTPAAETGSTFTTWSGDCTGSGTCSFTMDQYRSVTATFTLNTYTITANASGNGSGGVTSAPGGISYTYPATSGAATTPINHGTSVTLSATAAAGSTVSWNDCTSAGGVESGNGTTLATCMFSSLVEGKTVTATFTLNTYTVTPSPGANGSMTPSTPQTVNYNDTTVFTVTPENGYRIDTVTGCGGNLVGEEFTTGPITSDCTVTATFSLGGYTVTPSAGANGSIFPATPQTIIHGSTTSFTVTPVLNYHVDNVTGCGGSLAGNIYTTGPIVGDCSVSATFAINTYELTVFVTGNGRGLVTSQPTGISCNDDCAELYDAGTIVTLTADPQAGSAFEGWSGDCTGTDPACDVLVDHAKNISAEFTYSFPWPMFLPGIINKATR